MLFCYFGWLWRFAHVIQVLGPYKVAFDMSKLSEDFDMSTLGCLIFSFSVLILKFHTTVFHVCLCKLSTGVMTEAALLVTMKNNPMNACIKTCVILFHHQYTGGFTKAPDSHRSAGFSHQLS